MTSRRVVPIGTSIRPTLLILPANANTLVPFRTFCSDRSEPVGPFVENDRNIGQCFDVIDIRRFIQIARFCRERRFGRGLAPVSFHRVDQSGLFSTDKSTCTITDFYMERKIGTENIFSQQPVFSACSIAIRSRSIARGYSARMYTSPFTGTYAVTANGHGFDHGVRIPSIIERSIKAPGSPSSALQTTYF